MRSISFGTTSLAFPVLVSNLVNSGSSGGCGPIQPNQYIEPNDLRDVLLFGQQASNLMAAMDISLSENWVLDLVWFPPSWRCCKTGDVSVAALTGTLL